MRGRRRRGHVADAGAHHAHAAQRRAHAHAHAHRRARRVRPGGEATSLNITTFLVTIFQLTCHLNFTKLLVNTFSIEHKNTVAVLHIIMQTLITYIYFQNKNKERQ